MGLPGLTRACVVRRQKPEVDNWRVYAAAAVVQAAFGRCPRRCGTWTRRRDVRSVWLAGRGCAAAGSVAWRRHPGWVALLSVDFEGRPADAS